MISKFWKTDEIISILSDNRWTIEKVDPGGDIDTTNLVIHYIRSPDDEWISVCGINRDLTNVDRDNCEIIAIEVRDNRGPGLNSADESTCIMFGVVCSRLRKCGYRVVPTYEYCL